MYKLVYNKPLSRLHYM